MVSLDCDLMKLYLVLVAFGHHMSLCACELLIKDVKYSLWLLIKYKLIKYIDNIE